MADTGFVLAGAGANNADAGNAAWSNPGNVTADDGTNATAAIASAGQTSQYLHATNFGLSVPLGATITGITVRVQRLKSAGGGNLLDLDFQLIKGGARTGRAKGGSTNWPGSATDRDYGGDLWGEEWTPAEVNASDFGVAIRAMASSSGATAAVDAIWIKVTYEVVAAPLDTGFVVAGAGANNADAGTTAWSNPGNVTADDGSSATVALSKSGTSQYLHATNFGLSVPIAATITGVTVRIQRSASGVELAQVEHTVQLIVGGTRSGNNLIDADNRILTSMTNIDFGRPGEKWGLGLAPSDVNASNFGVALRQQSASSNTLSVDVVSVRVSYTLPASAKMLQLF